MKSLTDVLEKLSIDSIVLATDFPIDGSIKDMIDFLEDAGFKEVPSCGVWSQTFENYKRYNGKCFAIDRSNPESIEIIDRSNSKFKNKLFYITLKSDSKYNIFNDITTARSGWDARQVSKETFLEELSEIL